MTLKIPKVIAHRGCAAYAPENTLEAIHTAADIGAEWVEFDVRLTKDQVPVVFHDDTLDRTTNGHGNIDEITYDDLQQLEAGSWYGDSFSGIKIPTLEEAIDVLIDRDLGVNIEIKSILEREAETAEVVLDQLSQCWESKENIIISSYSHVALETSLNMIPDWARSVVIGHHCVGPWLDAVKAGKLPEDWETIADYLELSALSIDHSLCSRENVDAIHESDRKVLAFTINDPDQARTLQGLGVDSFFSDEPDTIKDGLFTVH